MAMNYLLYRYSHFTILVTFKLNLKFTLTLQYKENMDVNNFIGVKKVYFIVP